LHGLLVVSALTALSAATPQPVFAQAWIGETLGRMMAQQAQHQCMMGITLPEDEVLEALRPASETVETYWRLVRAPDRRQIAALFHPSRKARWVSGNEVLAVGSGHMIDDRYSRAAASLAKEPAGFARAGNNATARGLWHLYSASGEIVGAYLADFARRKGKWKLTTLRVLGAGEPIPTVTPYCEKPGDVEAYRARMAAIEADRAERSARRVRERGLTGAETPSAER
jgi:hypothetical protein